VKARSQRVGKRHGAGIAASGRMKLEQLAWMAIAAIPLLTGADGGCTSPPPGLVAFSATYNGPNGGSSSCDTSHAVHGYAPADTGATRALPVFVFLPGTGELYDPNIDLLLQDVAKRGYLAVYIEYDNFQLQDCRSTYEPLITSCAFDATSATSAVAAMCGYTNGATHADCANAGLVVSGLSQGAGLAMYAANYDARVRAVWAISVSDHANGGFLGIYDATCYLDDPAVNPASTRKLPSARLRVVDGIADELAMHNALDPTTGQPMPGTQYLQALIGRSCAGPNCLAADGSGYYLVQASDVAPAAGYVDLIEHCWLDDVPAGTGDCGGGSMWDPAIAPGAGATGPASVDANLDWLDSFVQH
jgi:hypothetical protein